MTGKLHKERPQKVFPKVYAVLSSRVDPIIGGETTAAREH